MMLLTEERPAIRTLYVSAAIVFLTAGLVPWGYWFPKYFGSDFGTLNLVWLQGALILSGLGLAVLLALRFVDAEPRSRLSPNSFIFHLLLIVLVFHASCVIVQLWKSGAQKTPYTRTEEVVLLSALASDGLLDLYNVSNLSRPPFNMGLYGPVYYAVVGPILRSGGAASLGGRLVSIIAILLVAGLLGTRWLAVPHRVHRLTAPLLFLLLFASLAWSVSLLKPEFLAGALGLSGLIVFVRWGATPSMRWVAPAATLFAGALLTKLSVFACFAAVTLFLALAKRFKECLSLVSLVLLLVFCVYAFLWVATEGGIWMMTVKANGLKLIPSQMLELGINETLTSILSVMIAASAIILIIRRSGKAVDQVVSFFLVIALSMFVLSTARPGATPNYFFEAAIAGAMVFSVLIVRYLEARDDNALTLLFVLLTVGMLTLVPRAAFETAIVRGPLTARGEVADALSRLRVAEDEWVLADEDLVMELWHARIPPLMIGTSQYTAMIDSGVLDTKPVMKTLVEGKVPYLVLSAAPEVQLRAPYGRRGWPIEILEYLNQNYKCSKLESGSRSDRGPFLCEYAPTGRERN